MTSTLKLLDTVDGYLSIWAYTFYFVPGRLKLQTTLHEISARDLKQLIEESAYESWLAKSTRRWLQKGEMPFPGYCRSPGSGKCLPVLCNCEKLSEIWKKIRKHKSHNIN